MAGLYGRIAAFGKDVSSRALFVGANKIHIGTYYRSTLYCENRKEERHANPMAHMLTITRGLSKGRFLPWCEMGVQSQCSSMESVVSGLAPKLRRPTRLPFRTRLSA
jgi:hypothetical protein